MSLKELKEQIEKIEIGYDYESVYCDLYNAVIDYQNDSQEWDFEYLFEDYIDYDLAEERAKYELENGGLARLQCYLNDVSVYGCNLFRIDGYGNLENVYKDDLEYLKEGILDIIDDKLKEVK